MAKGNMAKGKHKSDDEGKKKKKKKERPFYPDKVNCKSCARTVDGSEYCGGGLASWLCPNKVFDFLK